MSEDRECCRKLCATYDEGLCLPCEQKGLAPITRADADAHYRRMTPGQLVVTAFAVACAVCVLPKLGLPARPQNAWEWFGLALPVVPLLGFAVLVVRAAVYGACDWVTGLAAGLEANDVDAE